MPILHRAWATAIGDARAGRQALIALGLNASTSLVAGAFLGSMRDTFAEKPGLLVLVPAAIGLRGNTFTPVGNRLSTAIHTGTFSLSRNPRSVLGQNVTAAVVLTIAVSVLLGVVAKVIAVALGQAESVPLADFVTVSTIGGVLASAVVLASTIGIAGGAVRWGWDLDDVGAPLVSTLGDVITLPALWLAIGAAGVAVVTPSIAVTSAVVAAVVVILALRSSLDQLPRIVRQSLPVLVLAAAVSALAGVTVERQLEPFTTHPALLVLLPAFLSSCGAVGGILSGRLGTKLHLGLIEAVPVPGRLARRDIAVALALSVPVFAFDALGATAVASLVSHDTPGLGTMLAVTMLGGAVAMAAVILVAYYGTVAAFRVGLDPDTYGIPVVTSTVDFTGAVALVLAIVMVGLG
ncbi:MAG TPA: magnesium transporter [Acidimicrobiales bacterium]|nr:magnesium transporter [Acidimicrobiales bacterium]